MPASLSLLPCEPFGVASLGALAGDAPTLVLIASNEAMMSNKLRETLMSFAGRFNAKELDAAVAGVSRVPPSGVRKLARKGGVSYPLVSDEGRAWLGSLRVPASGAPCAFVVEVATGRVVASFGTENAQPLLDRVTAKLRKMKQGPEEPSARQDALTELRPNDTTEAATATSAATNAATNAATDAATDAAARSAVAVGSPAAASPSQQLSAIEAENQRLRAELEAARAASEAAAAAAAEAERMAAARAERIRLEKEIEEEKARAARAQAEAEAAMRAGAEERARKEAAKAKAAAETKAKEQAKARAEFKAREDAKVEKLRQAAAKKEAEAARETERKSKRAQKAAAKVEAKVEAKAEAKAEVSVEERVEERAEESDVADDVGGDRMSSTREAAAAEAAAAATATPQPSETFSATVSADGSTAASESADAFSLRSGSLLPPLPLSALRSLGNGVAPTTLAQLGAGADRVLVLAGLPDSAGSLLKALRTAERTLGRTAAALNVRVTGLCVGGGPAMLSMPLKQAAAKKWISFPLFDDPNGAVLGSLGVKQPQIGAVYALLLGDIPTDADADVEAYSSAGDGADDVDAQGTLLAAFGARDALKLCDTALSILKSAPPPVTAASVAADAATATAATTSATTVPAPAPSPPPPPPALSVQTTFAADETLERSWSELLGDRGARGRGRNEWRERREGGRGALRRDAQDEAPRAILRRDDTTSFPATKYKYVFLPKLRTVMKLLNQTEGVAQVRSSRISVGMPGAQRPLAVGVDGDVDGVVDGNNDADGGDAKASAGFLDALFSAFSGTSSAAEGADAGKSLAQSAIADSLAADSGAEGDAEGARSPLKMLIFMSGSGYGGAVRLVARGGKGWEGKTQQLFVTLTPGFTRARLAEVLRAMKVVLDFDLVIPPSELSEPPPRSFKPKVFQKEQEQRPDQSSSS